MEEPFEVFTVIITGVDPIISVDVIEVVDFSVGFLIGVSRFILSSLGI